MKRILMALACVLWLSQAAVAQCGGSQSSATGGQRRPVVRFFGAVLRPFHAVQVRQAERSQVAAQLPPMQSYSSASYAALPPMSSSQNCPNGQCPIPQRSR